MDFVFYGKQLFKTVCPSTKTGMVMRLLILFILGLTLSAPARVLSQSVSLSVKGETLGKVFSAIKKKTGYVFFYDEAILRDAKPVTIDVNDQPLDKVLTQVLQGQPYGFAIQDKTINIFKKNVNLAVTSPAIQTESTQALPPPPPITVHGRVTNEKGEPVAGATVTIKGTQNRTATNDNGEFTIQVPDANTVLVFSAITIETYEVQVNGKTEVLVRVNTKVNALEDVVVNKGYYTVRQQANTGNVFTVKSEDIQKQPVTNPLAALQARVPGLYIQQSNGNAGAGFVIRLRGQNSIAGNNNPLFIIDGMPFPSSGLNTQGLFSGNMSPLNYLNLSDIESIDVLKDADATAIYGSRGANGVILITTKKGKENKTSVDFNIYQGIGQVGHFMQLLNTQQYLLMRREAFKYDNAVPGVSDYDLNGAWDTTRNTDWQKTFIGGTAHYSDAQLNINWGNANTQFVLGGGYHRENSIYSQFNPDLSDQKGSMHFSLNNISNNKRLRSSFQLSYVFDDNKMFNGNELAALSYTLPPNAPALYNTDGSLNWQNSTWTNPLGTLKNNSYETKTYNLVAGGNIGYEIMPNLLFKVNFGYNSIQFGETSLARISATDPAYLIIAPANFTGQNISATNVVNNWLIEPQISYRKTFKFGVFDFLVGSTYQQNTQSQLSVTGIKYTTDALIESISAAPQKNATGSSSQYKYNSVFGRIGYSYDEKYFLNLTARRDGSSRFGPNKQFGNFGAVGAGWIFSKEKFFLSNLSFLSFGKIRASYGITGSEPGGDYLYLDTYSSTTNPYQGVNGLFPTSLYNGDFAWESNRKFEVGMDLGFLKDRINLNVSYYNNISSNQLVGYPLPPSTGGSSITSNWDATVRNTGLEFAINANPFKRHDFNWEINATLSFPRNKLLSYPNIEGSSYANTYVVGQSLFVKKKTHYLGLDPQTGLYTFDTKNANGVPTSPGDLYAIKEVGQKYHGGLQNTFKYKNWQLDFLLQFVKQNAASFAGTFDLPGRIVNQPIQVLERWQQPGDAGPYEGFSRLTTTPFGQRANAFKSSDGIYVDASFVRLKNLSLSYQLPQRVIQKLHIQRSRIYLQGQNLLTVTKYIGLDPEQSSINGLPSLRVLTLGIQVTF